MKYLYVFCLIILCQLLVGCTISHEFGPYQGKVVDKETLKPLKGAVVHIVFLTEFGYSPGGAVSHYADAVETLTDKNGEFYIPVHKLTLFRMFHGWEEFGHVIIFLPGYGAFPRHKESVPKYSPTYSIPPEEYVTIQLPKLHTIEERKRNMPSAGFFPEDKQMNLLRLKCIERVLVGLKPTKYCGKDVK